jgi:endonuclease/exonuclease/phosphatase (EEP) superfamily protein YafD
VAVHRGRRLLSALGLVGLLAPALLLTALRLAQPGAGWAVRSVSFAPYALPLYLAVALALLVVVGRAVSHRAGARVVALRAGALLMVLVLMLLHVTWVMPAFTGAAPAASPGSPRLRVMTLNVLHDGATAQDVTRTVRAADADVVVLQEVTRRLWRGLAATGVRDTHPHAAGLSPRGRHDTVVLGRSRVARERLLDTVGDSMLVSVRLGARTVDLLAAHPRYPELASAWRGDHATLAATVREVGPAVLAGDFNATYDHATMRRYRDLGYRSAAEILNTGWRPTWPANGHREVLGVPLPRLVHIDHVMVARRMTAVTVEHLEVPRSDHTAVVAEVAPR